MSSNFTAERVSLSVADNVIFQRSKLAYIEAGKIIHGDVLEIGTGCGYGVDFLSPHCAKFVTIDKNNPAEDSVDKNVTFKSMNVPPVLFPDCSFDCVVSFQTIEHIPEDLFFVREVKRVLRPGGIFIVTTPNSKMSLTRNPWHIREYTIDELSGLLSNEFSSIKPFGVIGNEKVMSYYEANKKNVDRLFKLDPLHLVDRMPRALLKKIYDIGNYFNRKLLLRKNKELTVSVTEEDYTLVSDPADHCFDLFFIATK